MATGPDALESASISKSLFCSQTPLGPVTLPRMTVSEAAPRCDCLYAHTTCVLERIAKVLDEEDDCVIQDMSPEVNGLYYKARWRTRPRTEFPRYTDP